MSINIVSENSMFFLPQSNSLLFPGFNHLSTVLATGSADHSVKLWDVDATMGWGLMEFGRTNYMKLWIFI
jgi:WD40 repeat protein